MTQPHADPALQIRKLSSWYGESQVLFNIDLDVYPGEVVTLLGRNGAGRSTLLRSIFGLTDRSTGSIRVFGTEATGIPRHRIAGLGLGYCPEERGIFASLSCLENLLLPPALPNAEVMTLEQIYSLFPNLKARSHSHGGRLSGGEQQMLAIARILRTGARILLLDEISEGLAPVIVQQLAGLIAELRRRGYTILMVEQNFRFAAPLSDRFYVLEHGQITDGFLAADLDHRRSALEDLLSI
jgi:branched-chain amino acid transport system ATP-binding protein